MIQLTVNGSVKQYDGDPAMPVLWYLRDLLELTGAKFGCGMGLCGACTVQAPHRPIPQPNFAPVSSSRSRRYHSTGIAGSPSYCLTDPLTVS